MTLLSRILVLAPYASAVKLGLLGAAVAAAAWAAWSYHDRGRQIERLESRQSEIVHAVAGAVGSKDLKAEDVVAAVNTLEANLDGALNALDVISAQTRQAQADSDARDADLRERLAQAQQKYRAATSRIDDLSRRRPAATSAEAAAQIEDDSKAAWEGWSK